MTRFYFHPAFHSDESNMPQTNQHNLTPTSGKVVDAFTRTRTMNTSLGTNDTFSTITMNSTTSTQTAYFHRFATEPLALAASGVSANTWTYNFGGWSEHSSSNYPVSGTDKSITINCYVWRPSTQTKVGTIRQGTSAAVYDEFSPTASWRSAHGTFTGSAVGSLQDGDVIIMEAWSQVTFSAADAYGIHFLYDGNTVTTTNNTLVSNHAAFLESPQTFSVVQPDIDMTNSSTKVLTNKFITKV